MKPRYPVLFKLPKLQKAGQSVFDAGQAFNKAWSGKPSLGGAR